MTKIWIVVTALLAAATDPVVGFAPNSDSVHSATTTTIMRPRTPRKDTVTPSILFSSSSSSTANNNDATEIRDKEKERLLDLIASVPRNAATSRQQTRDILECVRELEPYCPTPDTNVLAQSAGTWELLWTAQDDQASGPLSAFRWINPLENQAYSNNPTGGGGGGGGGGRANPVLPLDLQDFLTDRGILKISSNDDGSSQDDEKDPSRISTQSIDVKNRRVINVVSLPVALPFGASKNSNNNNNNKPVSLTVRVDFTPYTPDPRRVNVKFQSFSVGGGGDKLRLNLPLGFIGPTGWLRTTFLDDTLRITRGHKGSVFVLRRRGGAPRRE